MTLTPFVILSGKYCPPEIVAEFGLLPPAFLPIGHARLYEHQIKLAKSLNTTPIITIPSDYEIEEHDIGILISEGIRIIRSPASLSLGEAVQLVLEIIDTKGPLILMHGDTLVGGPRLLTLDSMATSSTDEYYMWGDVTEMPNGGLMLSNRFIEEHSRREVACGYFIFSDVSNLRKSFMNSNDFTNGINKYSNTIPLKPLPISDWFDFGQLSLLYRSKRDLLVSRAFNTIECDGLSVTKRSSNSDKIDAEIDWYRSIPAEMKLYTPQFLGEAQVSGEKACKLEYLYYPTLAELYVFGLLPEYQWKLILQGCTSFMEACRSYTPPTDSKAADINFANNFFDSLIVEKSRLRIDEFLNQRGWNSKQSVNLNGIQTPCLKKVIEDLLMMVPATTANDISLWHGDFFFGNILYDFRAKRLRVIDPRGEYSKGCKSIYGDWRYDAAKLAHSIYGGYDSLLSGRVNFERISQFSFNFSHQKSSLQINLEKEYSKMYICGSETLSTQIKALVGLLFISMLPLHKEDQERQNVLLCNGLMIHRELTGGSI